MPKLQSLTYCCSQSSSLLQPSSTAQCPGIKSLTLPRKTAAHSHPGRGHPLGASQPSHILTSNVETHAAFSSTAAPFLCHQMR